VNITDPEHNDDQVNAPVPGNGDLGQSSSPSHIPPRAEPPQLHRVSCRPAAAAAISREPQDPEPQQHARPVRVKARPAIFDPAAYTAAKQHDDKPPPVMMATAQAPNTANQAAPRSSGNPVRPINDDPKNFREAMSSADSKRWCDAIRKELRSHHENKTWRLISDYKGRLVGCTWAFRRKLDADGNVSKYKARLCAQGFSQIEGEDFEESYAGTPRWNSLRFLLAYATQHRLALHQADVNCAYLAADLPPNQRMYMRIPPGYTLGYPHAPRHAALLLYKSLYGLRQAGYLWSAHFHSVMRAMGLVRMKADSCLYISFKHRLLLLVYVDDLIIATLPELMAAFKRKLGDRLSIKDEGQLHWFLSNKIEYDINRGTLRLSQTALAKRILQSANMEKCNGAPTPIIDRLYPSPNPATAEEQAFMAKIPYRSIVGALLYLCNCSRPDLAYATNQLCRYMSNARPEHWQAAKRCLRYVQSTSDYGLVYQRTDPPQPWVAFADADFAGDAQDRKSTSGICFCLASATFAWRVMKQRCIALSTCEAEIIALNEAAKEATWLMQLAKDFGADFKTITIREDNQAAIALTNGDKFSQRTKHMDVRYFFIKEKIQDGTIKVEYVSTTDQLADMFTKPLPKIVFSRLRDALGVRGRE